MTRIVRLSLLFWAGPWTIVGLLVGLLAVVSGGQMRGRGPAVAIWGGAASWLLCRLPKNPVAMTLGHTVLGRTESALDVSWEHELVHVRQYERWGPLFVPAYLLCSFVLWFLGRDAYLDNPFEREAYGDRASEP